MSGIRGNGRQSRVVSASAPYSRSSNPRRGPGARGNSGGGGRSGNNTRVYVGNLSWEVSWQDLKDHFKASGRVVRADVLEEHNGRSKGCGIVEFSTAAEAEQAIRDLNDTDLKGRSIFVREDREQSGGSGGGGSGGGGGGGGKHNASSTHREFKPSSDNHSPPAAKLGVSRFVYVGNLAYEVKWQDLKDHMKSAGEVLRADVLEESGSGRSKGCGVVEFATVEDANRAIKHLNNTDLKGRLIYVREDREREGVTGNSGAGGASGDGARLYVGNLAWDVRWQDLKDHFKQIGKVVRADVMMEEGGSGDRSKGWGIVEFASSDEAQRAIDELNNTELHDRPIHVREDRESSGSGGGGGRR